MRTETTTYAEAVEYLNLIFDLLNEDFFESALSRPTITVQSTPKAFGHFLQKTDAWIAPEQKSCEINIGAGTLARPIDDTVGTMLHEMIHYWNFSRGIKDCSRGGKYHNKKFKAAAEAKGLRVIKIERYGWAITEPTDQIRDFVNNHSLTDIQIFRNEGYFYVKGDREETGEENEEEKSQKKKSSTRKYICPCCGISVRATKVVRIMCMDCNAEMILDQ